MAGSQLAGFLPESLATTSAPMAQQQQANAKPVTASSAKIMHTAPKIHTNTARVRATD